MDRPLFPPVPFLLLLWLCASVFPARPELKLLVKMIPIQADWLEKNVLKDFERENGVSIRLQNFETFQEMEAFAGRNKSFDVIKVPMDRAVDFREGGNLCPVSSIADDSTLKAIREAYVLPPLAVNLDTIFYVPRKLETRIMVYRVSKVKEALAGYRTLLPEISMAVALINQKGLPEGYVLEDNPDEWDYFDVLVAGYVWAKAAGGSNPGKVGHRGKNYEGTMLRIVDRAFQCGATRGEIPFLTSPPVTEAFGWEYVYSKLKIYNASMFEENWTGQDLWKVFGQEDIYLTFLTQLDCFFLLGTGQKGLEGFFKDADDVEFALMPRAAPLSGGESIFANRNVTTGGWFWAVGKESVSKPLALKLILAMTSRENQEKEFNAFGTFPTRKALLKQNNDKIYLKRWQNRMLQTSIRQVELNRHTVLPTFRDMDALQNRYYKVLRILCVRPDQINTLEQVRNIISINEPASQDEETP